MKPTFNEEFSFNKKFKIIVFFTSVYLFAFLTNLNASLTQFNNNTFSGKLQTSYLSFNNMLLQINEKANFETVKPINQMVSKFLQVKISPQKTYSSFPHPVKKAPITSYFLPFFMMTLAYTLWKIHKRSMKRNGK